MDQNLLNILFAVLVAFYLGYVFGKDSGRQRAIREARQSEARRPAILARIAADDAKRVAWDNSPRGLVYNALNDLIVEDRQAFDALDTDARVAHLQVNVPGCSSMHSSHLRALVEKFGSSPGERFLMY